MSDEPIWIDFAGEIKEDSYVKEIGEEIESLRAEIETLKAINAQHEARLNGHSRLIKEMRGLLNI